jgi:hypothetical protein
MSRGSSWEVIRQRPEMVSGVVCPSVFGLIGYPPIARLDRLRAGNVIQLHLDLRYPGQLNLQFLDELTHLRRQGGGVSSLRLKARYEFGYLGGQRRDFAGMVLPGWSLCDLA